MTTTQELIEECMNFDTSIFRDVAHANSGMTAKLQEAADTIQALQKEVDALKADAEKADMFWNHDDAEVLYQSIDEFLNEEICNGAPLEVGHTRTIQRAVRLPNIEIRVTSIDEESCEAEYEIIDAAKGNV